MGLSELHNLLRSSSILNCLESFFNLKICRYTSSHLHADKQPQLSLQSSMDLMLPCSPFFRATPELLRLKFAAYISVVYKVWWMKHLLNSLTLASI